MKKPSRPVQHRRPPLAGFTLVELMVAVTIGLVVVLGFAVTFVNMKVTFNTQDKMAQLQDNERLAMSILTSSLQEAGYYDNCADPTTTPITPPSCKKSQRILGLSAFASSPGGGATTGSQIIMGTFGGASTPETLTTIYTSTPGDGVMSCQGTTIASAVTTHPVEFRNTFYVDSTTNTLGCKVGAYDVSTSSPVTMSSYPLAYAPLVSNVTGMSVKYAVDTTNSGGPTQYQTASAVADWSTVKGAQVTLTFVNPNSSLGGASSIQWVQNINLMNNK